MKKIGTLIINLFFVIVLVSFSGCNSEKTEESEKTTDQMIDVIPDTFESEKIDEIDIPDMSDSEEFDGIDISSESLGVLQNFMNNVYGSINENGYENLELLPTWDEQTGSGVFFDTDDYRDVIWATFFDDNIEAITQDSGNVKYSYITVYALNENADLLSKYLPFFIVTDYPEATLDEAQEIVNACLETGSFENNHASYYYDESDEFIHFYIALKDRSISYDEQSLNSDLEAREYTLLDGKMSLKISENEYDVFQQDNTDNQLSLKRQGLSQEKVDAYMQATNYDLKAVPVGSSLTNGEVVFTINIKPDKYPGIESLNKFSQEDKDALASSLIASFPETNGYEWYSTDSADFYVFETQFIEKEIRYATIVDGCMIYVFLNNPDENAEWIPELQKIIDTIEFH